MDEPPFSICKKWTLFTIALVETALFGGNVFGWAQLAHILKGEGIYTFLCNSTATTANSDATLPEVGSGEALFKGCKEQDLKFSLVYLTGVVAITIGAFLMGDFLHRFGLRIIRLISVQMIIIGFIFLGLATQERPHLVFVGIIVLSVGNSGTRAVGLQFAELFPQNRMSALSLMGGSFATSGGLFLFVQLATAHGISRSHAFWFLAGVSALSIPATFIMPKDRIVPYRPGMNPNEAKLVPIKLSLCSVSCVLYFLWVSISLFSFNVMNAFMNPWISEASKSPVEAALYSKLFSFSTFLCPLYAFVPGFVTDWFSRILSSDGSPRGDKTRDIKSCFCSLFCTTLLCMTMLGCLLVHAPSAIYLGIFCLSFCRPTVVGMSANFARIRFPTEHLDRLFGYAVGLSMLTTPITYLVARWSKENYFQAIAFVIGLEAAILSFPLHILSTKYLKKITRHL